jgi:hypothetical protein
MLGGMSASVDHATRQVTIGKRVFRLEPKRRDSWNVYEGDKLVGWLLLSLLPDGKWQVHSDDHGVGGTVSIQMIGRTWTGSFADNQSPLPT